MTALVSNSEAREQRRHPLPRLRQGLRRIWLFVRDNELNGLGDTIA